MNDDERADIGVDLVRAGLDLADVKQLLRLGINRPGRAYLAATLIEALAHRNRREPRHHGLLWIRERVDELHDVVFEELLLRRIEEFDGSVAVGGVGACEAEEELGARCAD